MGPEAGKMFRPEGGDDLRRHVSADVAVLEDGRYQLLAPLRRRHGIVRQGPEQSAEDHDFQRQMRQAQRGAVVEVDLAQLQDRRGE